MEKIQGFLAAPTNAEDTVVCGVCKDAGHTVILHAAWNEQYSKFQWKNPDGKSHIQKESDGFYHIPANQAASSIHSTETFEEATAEDLKYAGELIETSGRLQRIATTIVMSRGVEKSHPQFGSIVAFEKRTLMLNKILISLEVKLEDLYNKVPAENMDALIHDQCGLVRGANTDASHCVPMTVKGKTCSLDRMPYQFVNDSVIELIKDNPSFFNHTVSNNKKIQIFVSIIIYVVYLLMIL